MNKNLLLQLARSLIEEISFNVARLSVRYNIGCLNEYSVGNTIGSG